MTGVQTCALPICNQINDLRSFNGGGIGIIVASYNGTTANNNTITGNEVTGTLHVGSCDSGGYDGSGIVVYADFRGGSAGASILTGNLVSGNTVTMVSDNPTVVDMEGLELTESKDAQDPPLPEVPSVITGNTLDDNDVSVSGHGIAITGSSSNSITGNTVSNSGGSIYLTASGGAVPGISYSCSNTVSGNSFLDNTVQAEAGSCVAGNNFDGDRKSTRLNSSHIPLSRMPSSA